MRWNTWPCLIAVLALLLPWLALAEDSRPPIVVTPGQGKAFRAAVQLFLDEAQPIDPKRAPELRSLVGEGLTFSGVLLPLADEAFLGDLATSKFRDGPRFDCVDWTQSGADALVEGKVSREEKQLVIEYQVWDTARCKRLERGRLAGPDREMIRLAKLLADDVVEALTGMPGAAGSEIAFISDRSGERQVWVMDADGSRQRVATRGGSIKAFPDWMPDGKAILYTAYDAKGVPGLKLTSRGEYRAGSLLTRVLVGLPKYRGVFGPTGRHLAMVSSLDGSAEIYRVDRSGEGLRRLTQNAAIDISPTWSPDGSQIAFVSDRSGAPQIYLMNRDGGALRRLTFNGSYNTSPSWSPDGRWIAYETRVEGQFDLWLIDPSGEVNVPLATHRRSDESPAWSPDGRMLAFSSTRRGRADIYVIDLGGENLKRLTKGHGNNLQPSWGPFAR